MKVYLPAIAGHVPPQMVRALSAFMDFCYLVRRSVIDEDTLIQIDDALSQFHHHRIIFQTSGVRPDGFSLPRQHSLTHYRYLIQLFGSPNGLCSSITESKHIKAVKEPWRRSNHYEALGQMLLTNQRIDKLAAARVDFEARGMLTGPCLPPGTDPPPNQFVANSSNVHVDPDNDDRQEDGDVDGPTYQGEVKLARTKGTSLLFKSLKIS